MAEDENLRDRLNEWLTPEQREEALPLLEELLSSARRSEESLRSAEGRVGKAESYVREEGTRLEKLWEAFKSQEREVWDLREKAKRLEDSLAGKDDASARLESVISERDEELRRIRSENDALTERAIELERRVESLGEAEKLRVEAEEYKAKHAEYVERLAKLYALYEEAQADRDSYKKELAARDQWFEENQDALKAVRDKLKWRGVMVKKKV